MTLLSVTALGIALQAILFAFFVGLSAVFAASQGALETAPSYYRRQLGLPRPSSDRALGPPEDAFAAVLVGKHLANVAAGGLAVALALSLIPTTWPVAVLVGVLGGAFVLLTVGEIAPRAAASRDPSEEGPDLTGAIRLTFTLLGPLARLTARVASLRGRAETGASRVFLDEREIKNVVEAGEEQGVLEEAEHEMISAVIEFGDEDVGDVMAPRTDVVAVEASSPVEEVAGLVTETGYSRIPVYREDLDNIVGVVYAKDLLDAVQHRPKDPVDSLMKETLFVPETAPLDEVLREMKTRRIHVAIVHDEFGGTAGLVTLEDLLEEIVGDIFDEYDPETHAVEPAGDGEVILDARMDLERVNEELGISLPADPGYETLGGFLFHKLGRPGREGEDLDHDGVSFTLEEVENRRILKVRVALAEDDVDEIPHDDGEPD